MPLPMVAIVGRPNVGKSSLMNTIARRMVSIVEPTAGVTRDRVSTLCEVDDVYFELVDTGGYGIEDRDGLTEHIEGQIFYAIDKAALILFVVDVKDAVTPLDLRMAELLRPNKAKVQLVVNKVDSPAQEPQAAQFATLGYGDPICISALHHMGRTDLLDAVVARIRDLPQEPPGEPLMKLAVVGRRNTGKSTFINALAGEPRVIVSDVPGTTRDAIDVRVEKDGQELLIIDTAGVKKKSKLVDAIEYFGFTRVARSIRRADVVLFFIDATVPISEVDKKLAVTILDEHKPVVLVINKWDLAVGRTETGTFGEYLEKTIPMMDFAPVAFISASESRNIWALIDAARSIYNQSRQRVSTGQLNAALRRALEIRTPSAKRGTKAPKLYYATQVAVAPPTLVLFVNDHTLVSQEYQRFLVNRFREVLPFEEVPIRLVIRSSRGGAVPVES